jgi:N-carbamoylputrescine amidase
MTVIKVAATQMACSWERDENIARAEGLVREAAGAGAQVVLLQELFETPYFPKDEDVSYYELAKPIEENAAIRVMQPLARELEVVLPVSVFERANNSLFNTLIVIDADGAILGKYRKSHIPDAPGYSEKYYFNPGDTGFRVWNTRYGKIGAAICWDQWFPEVARILALKGAEVILYPTAIGSNPNEKDTQALRHWQQVMQGHAAANMVPIVASNRIGTEQGKSCSLRFFGSSFISNSHGEKIAEADQETESFLVTEIDLESANQSRIYWNLFRDRRPDLYRELLSLDGEHCHPAIVETPGTRR